MKLDHSEAFGAAIRQELASRGLSLRSQRIRTGIDHMTMQSMAQGLIPRLEKVEQFARAFGLNVNEWRQLAGYEPVEALPDPASCSYMLIEQMRQDPERVREAVSQIVAEYRATYEAAPASPAPEPPHYFPSEADSPYLPAFARWVKAAWAKYAPTYTLYNPYTAKGGHGWEFKSQSEAWAEFREWLRSTLPDNPGKAEYEELRKDYPIPD